MGQEAEKAQRLKDFNGYQVTEDMAARGGTKKDWNLCTAFHANRKKFQMS
jgi:hypothetical protein